MSRINTSEKLKEKENLYFSAFYLLENFFRAQSKKGGNSAEHEIYPAHKCWQLLTPNIY